MKLLDLLIKLFRIKTSPLKKMEEIIEDRIEREYLNNSNENSRVYREVEMLENLIFQAKNSQVTL